MNKRICAAVVAVIALTAGCAGGPATAPPATTTTTTAPTLAELNERAKAAIPAPDAFAGLGGKFKSSEPANDSEIGVDGQPVTFICGGRDIRADDTSVARSRIWTGDLNLLQDVHAMAERTAAVLVESVKTGLVACTQARSVEHLTTMTKPEGVDDFHAYCEATMDPDLLPFSCHALMGRGTLITEVVTFGPNKVMAGLQLAVVLPVFAQSFAKA